MEEQMELFEDGGLKDEGGMVDEESGNDVPVGSTKKEVRDDIPAMLSEGEFVLPADVVRYHGLEKIMQLRDEAKFGLKKMEAMGQMGNSDEATLDDDVPFGPADLIIVGAEPMEDEPREMAQGGMVYAQTGTYVPPATGIMGYQPSIYQGQQTTSTYTPPPSSVAPPAPAPSPAGGYVPKFVTNQTTPFDDGSLTPKTTTTQTAANTSSGVSTASTEDKFFDTVDTVYTTKEYINPETGERRTISFYQGNPVTDIPEGFIPLEDYEENQTDDLESTSVQTTQVTTAKEDNTLEKVRLANMTKQQTGSAIDALKDAKPAAILDAWNKNQKTKAIMTSLSLINPIVGMAGRAAASHFGNQLEDLMEEKGIDIPDQTEEKQNFLQKLGSNIGSFFSSMGEGISSIAEGTTQQQEEEGSVYMPIYSPEDSPFGRNATRNLLTTTNTGSMFTSSQAEAYDNAVNSGNVNAAQHYEIINNLYNKMADYAAGKPVSGLSQYDMETATKLFDSEGNRQYDTVNQYNAAQNNGNGNNTSPSNNNTDDESDTSSDKNIVDKVFDAISNFFGGGDDD